MNLIDEIMYLEPNRRYTKEEILSAYKTLFAVNSLPARIVLTDLLMKTNYKSKNVPTDTNIFYHQSGLKEVIDFIRDGINTPYVDDNQIDRNIGE